MTHPFNRQQCPKCEATRTGPFAKDGWYPSVYESSPAVVVRYRSQIKFLGIVFRREHMAGHCHTCGANWQMECSDSMKIFLDVMKPSETK